MEELGSLPTQYSSNPASQASSVSGDGSITVGDCQSIGGDEAFRWTKADGIKGIGRLPGHEFAGGPTSRALAISADGKTIVGLSSSKNGEEAIRWTKDDGMVGLGDLSGKPKAFKSQATGVSRDGTVVVGYCGFANERGFKWTAKNGMQPLDSLPGGNPISMAKAVSQDGTTIVGMAQSQAVRWTDAKGVESIRQLLIDRGIDMTDWGLYEATAVSSDGNVIVGYGQNPSKNWEAWRVDLSAISVAK